MSHTTPTEMLNMIPINIHFKKCQSSVNHFINIFQPSGHAGVFSEAFPAESFL